MKMQWEKIKQRLAANFWALLDLFAQESDFINGQKRRQIHIANQRRGDSQTKSTKDSSTHPES